MTFTVDYTTPVGIIRTLIGDLDAEDMELSDESIIALLGIYGNDPKITAIYCLKSLAAKWTKRAITTKIEGFSAKYDNISAFYALRAKEISEATYQLPMVNSDGGSTYRNPLYPGGWVPM
jgi:hypothetical protein